MNLKPYG